MKKQLTEASDIQGKSDTKLSQALQGLRVLQEEKGSLEAKLGQKQAALQAQVKSSGPVFSDISALGLCENQRSSNCYAGGFS